jgi:transcriptional regulator with XRE-family HTH domain
MHGCNLAADAARKAGAQVRAVRQSLGLTLVDVALHSAGEFQPSALGNIERGERALSIYRAERLAAVYGVTLDQLLHATKEQLGELAKGRA